MPGVGLILVPYDGGLEKQLNASEAKSQQIIEDPVRATRLSELLEQRGVDVRFMFTERGVLMHGTPAQAMVVSRLVGDLPNLTPSQKTGNVQPLFAANDDNHISSAFAGAARRFNVEKMSPKFTAAANDEQVATVRGSRPAINGSFGARVLAAA